jgi:hypothetical protein
MIAKAATAAGSTPGGHSFQLHRVCKVHRGTQHRPGTRHVHWPKGSSHSHRYVSQAGP